jgi:hypothetical protein
MRARVQKVFNKSGPRPKILDLAGSTIDTKTVVQMVDVFADSVLYRFLFPQERFEILPGRKNLFS